jgi:hypothetical protein
MKLCKRIDYMPLKELLNEAKNLDLQEQIQLATQLLQYYSGQKQKLINNLKTRRPKIYDKQD